MKKIILQTLEILNNSEKKKLKIILFLTLISNFLEALSISLIFPLVGNLTNTNDKDQLQNFGFFKNIFSDDNLTNIFLIFLLVFFLKLVFILFYLYKKTSFIQNLAANLSLRILKKYITQNLNFFYNNNSSLLTRNIVQEISQLTSGVIEQTLSLVVELILVIL